jgi:hypothetical protein
MNGEPLPHWNGFRRASSFRQREPRMKHVTSINAIAPFDSFPQDRLPHSDNRFRWWSISRHP